MTIKDFLPPIVMRWLRGGTRVEKDVEYENYSLALQSCTADGYLDSELCNLMAEETLLYRGALNEKPFTLSVSNAFLLSAIIQYINRYRVKHLRILDFGGACGAHYFEIRRFLPQEVSLKWKVLETVPMGKAARDRGLTGDELEFVTSIDGIGTPVDLILSSGTLQYVSDPYAALDMLISIKANWMLFSRMMFNEADRDFVTVQRFLLSWNGPTQLPSGYVDRVVSYPHTTMSFHKFNSVIVNRDYESEWIMQDPSGSYPIKMVSVP